METKMINHPSDNNPASTRGVGSRQRAVPNGVLGVDQHGALESQTFKVNADTECLTTGKDLNQEYWRSCCGCHVRTATLWIGGISVAIRTLVLLLLIIRAVALSEYLRATDDDVSLQAKIDAAMKEAERIGMKVNVKDGPSWPNEFGAVDKDQDSNGLLRNFPDSSVDFKMETQQIGGETGKIMRIICITLITILLILLTFDSLMMHGALKYKPKLMIPYLVVNVFVICLRIIGLLIVSILAISQGFNVILLVVLITSLELILTMYFTWIIWRCYKYCVMRRRSLNQELTAMAQ